MKSKSLQDLDAIGRDLQARTHLCQVRGLFENFHLDALRQQGQGGGQATNARPRYGDARTLWCTHCGLMLLSLATCIQRGISVAMVLANSAEVLPTGRMSSLAMRSPTSGKAMMRVISS